MQFADYSDQSGGPGYAAAQAGCSPATKAGAHSAKCSSEPPPRHRYWPEPTEFSRVSSCAEIGASAWFRQTNADTSGAVPINNYWYSLGLWGRKITPQATRCPVPHSRHQPALRCFSKLRGPAVIGGIGDFPIRTPARPGPRPASRQVENNQTSAPATPADSCFGQACMPKVSFGSTRRPVQTIRHGPPFIGFGHSFDYDQLRICAVAFVQL